MFHDLFASQVFRPLPPRSKVFSLIDDFFRTANRLLPIFHKPSFMKMVEWQYTQQTCDDAARWASINMVICLAYEFRVPITLKPVKDRERAKEYFKNGMSVFTELALRRTDLLSVQALLSMVGCPQLSTSTALMTNVSRHFIFAATPALKHPCRSSQQPCDHVSAWVFTEVSLGQT